MTSIVGKKIGAVGSGHLELFPFVVLAICKSQKIETMLSQLAMLTSWSSYGKRLCYYVKMQCYLGESKCYLVQLHSVVPKILHMQHCVDKTTCGSNIITYHLDKFLLDKLLT